MGCRSADPHAVQSGSGLSFSDLDPTPPANQDTRTHRAKIPFVAVAPRAIGAEIPNNPVFEIGKDGGVS
jgi:hypothetical protein